jgi:hypothetical protein
MPANSCIEGMSEVLSKARSWSVGTAALFAALRNAESCRVCQYPQAKAVKRRIPRGIPTPTPKATVLQDLSPQGDVPVAEALGAFVEPEDEGDDEWAAMVPVMLTCCTAPGIRENVNDVFEQALLLLQVHWRFVGQYCKNSLLS